MASAPRGGPTRPDSPPCPPELTALAAVLANRLGAPPPLGSDTLDWSALDPQGVTRMAVRHRVVGLVSSSPDHLGLPDEALATLVRRQRRETKRTLKQAMQITGILNRFDEAGLPVLLMKGHAFAAQVYGDWAVRGPSADADLIISPATITDTDRVMKSAGYYCDHDSGHKPPLHGLLGRYNRWLHYERSYLHENGTSIDIHWRPVPGAASWTGFDNLWQGRATLRLYGQTVHTPGAMDTLRIAASQGEPDGWPTLRSAVDVVAAAKRLPPGQLRALVGRDRLVAAAVARASEILHVGNPDWWDPQPGRISPRWRREWDLRRRTSNPASAIARSALGKLLPARRFRPMDPDTRDPRYQFSPGSESPVTGRQ